MVQNLTAVLTNAFATFYLVEKIYLHVGKSECLSFHTGLLRFLILIKLMGEKEVQLHISPLIHSNNDN